MSGFWVWLILAAVFFVAEVMTTGFVLMWFGVGALVAALLAFGNLSGFGVQTAAFLAVSIALTIASRTIFERLLPKGNAAGDLKTGMDALPGQIGVVEEASSSETGEGAVRVFGSVWRAFPAPDEAPLRKGEQVQVERIEGVSIFVRRTGGEPSWRTEGRTGEGRTEGRTEGVESHPQGAAEFEQERKELER